MTARIVPRFVVCLNLTAGILALSGCPAPEGASTVTSGGLDTESDSAAEPVACEPGTEAECVCIDGSTGTQICLPSGDALGECSCESSGSTTTSESSGSGPSVDDGTDSSSGEAESSSTGDLAGTSTDTGEPQVCEPGTAVACECGDGPGAALCNDGGTGTGPCQCCEGAPAASRGDINYCEGGGCLCTTFDGDLPVAVCYGEVVADACCAAVPEC